LKEKRQKVIGLREMKKKQTLFLVLSGD